MIQMQLARPIFRWEHCSTLWHNSFSETPLTVDELEVSVTPSISGGNISRPLDAFVRRF
jgi:hypothetical protein